MTADLVTSLLTLVAEAGLDDKTVSLLWGAFEGDDALGQAIDGRTVQPPNLSATDSTAPVWLSSIAIEGFRGIGARAELLLSPRPGLTLVVGRNGSGKSSFADARSWR